MSYSLYLNKDSTPIALADNLKIAISSHELNNKLYNSIITDLFDNSSINNSKNAILLDSKHPNFHLFHSNTIVKYLKALSTSTFDKDLVYLNIESKLYSYLKNNKINESEINELISSFNDINTKDIAQIITFSSIYALIRSNDDLLSKFKWLNDFKSKVQPVIDFVFKNTQLKRIPQINNNKTNFKSNTKFIKKLNENEKLKPIKGERNILITSALPYVNNVPHLGNIVGSVLSADIFSRYCKDRNYNTLFICGTDEYGTATETKALEDKVTPKELCDKYHKIHKEVYEWFKIGFDYFGRTTTEKQTEIAQDIFMKLYNNGYLEEQVMRQLYCPEHNGYLADRYVEGECPKCSYEDARGDQCDKCGNLLDPFELINPRCKLDNATPIPKDSKHIFLSLDKLEPELKEWVEKSSNEGKWSKNAKTITNSWLKEGLKPRCITRDLVWGTPVPLDDFKDKVLYVWFDATIGYVSITANYTDDWKKWWKKENDEDIENDVKLYQFMGKDNVPFHTVVFPSTEIGTRDNWNLLHHLNTTEYLQYEGGKFSKSRNVGVFGNNAKDTGISPSIWRYYLASVRPENQDSQFSWTEFVTKNNSELLSNLGNFVNRIVKFVNAKYNGVIPNFKIENCPNYIETAKDEINSLLSTFIDDMENSRLRKGLETAMQISSRGNLFLQENKLDNSTYENQPEKADAIVGIGINLVYLVSSVIGPYMPDIRDKIVEILNANKLSIPDEFDMWIQPGHCIGKPQYLFNRIDEKNIEEWRNKYGGAKE
ncbi:methionine--tRNA ligase [Pichia kluyveri]|uniref:methionine--tRNA ligase n=1 Tax=Pichia kluyveri TaxID=36015 RepID=A0AAV5R5X4_PICKL|nr:methionine--tRNA ligase [Pichia kluyveri]